MARTITALALWGAIAAALPRLATGACDVVPVGAISLGERVRDVVVVGDMAYVAAGFDGLQIVDVTDPAVPVLVGSLDSAAFSQDVEVVGNLVYIADSSFEAPGGLRIVDVTDPAAPVEVSNTGSSFTRVDVSAGVAFATDPSSGLHVVDVSNAANPVEIAALDPAGFEGDVHVGGNLAYLLLDPANQSAAVRILDVSNLAAPTEIGAVDTGSRIPFDMEIVGDRGYMPVIGSRERGLMIYDLTNPATPVELAFLKSASSRGVRGTGERVYFAFGVDISFGGGPGGFRVIDVSDPTLPVDIGGADTEIDESTTVDVQVKPDGHWVFASMSGPNGGLRTFRVSNCPDVIPVDVVPGSTANWLPMTADDPVPVQISGSPSLDVANIPIGSLRFGPGAAIAMSTPGFEPVIADANGDGFDDLVVYFLASGAALQADDEQACVEGQHAGSTFVGCNWVLVNQPPVPVILSDPHHGVAPVWVYFDGTVSYDPEGGSLSYEWDFGAWSQSAVGPTLSRFLPVPGDYEVTLTVEDDFGQRSSTTYIADAVEVPTIPALPEWTVRIFAMLVLVTGVAMHYRPRRAGCSTAGQGGESLG